MKFSQKKILSACDLTKTFRTTSLGGDPKEIKCQNESKNVCLTDIMGSPLPGKKSRSCGLRTYRAAQRRGFEKNNENLDILG